MRAKCGCGKNFVAKLKRIMKNEDIQDIYFECPRCKKYYHVAFTDSEVRAFDKGMQVIREQLLDDKNNMDLFEQLQKMMLKHKEMIDELNFGGRCSEWE